MLRVVTLTLSSAAAVGWMRRQRRQDGHDRVAVALRQRKLWRDGSSREGIETNVSIGGVSESINLTPHA